jgi:hypothetical protein
MSSEKLRAIQADRAAEQLRQEQELFNQRIKQESQKFVFRLIVGYLSIFILVLIMTFSGYILLHDDGFSSSVINSARVALFAEILSLAVGILKTLSTRDTTSEATPITTISLPQLESEAIGSASSDPTVPTDQD